MSSPHRIRIFGFFAAITRPFACSTVIDPSRSNRLQHEGRRTGCARDSPSARGRFLGFRKTGRQLCPIGHYAAAGPCSYGPLPAHAVHRSRRRLVCVNVTADALHAVATCTILSARRIEGPMIKRIRPDTPSVAHEEWRNLDDEVEVELTSEDPDWPIERALLGQATSGWRANAPGPRTIRLAWPAPISIRRIRLVFEERSHARTQEFVVRAVTSDGEREIVRQQFTFSPPGTTVQPAEEG